MTDKAKLNETTFLKFVSDIKMVYHMHKGEPYSESIQEEIEEVILKYIELPKGWEESKS